MVRPSLAQVAAFRLSKLTREMRPNRLVLPLGLVLALVPAAPAAAFDWNANVIDFEFQPSEQKIAVGDSVTWNFLAEGHTSASAGGQPDSWKSNAEGANPAGSSYTHVFGTPGRFQYVCLQHKDFMKGVIEVGADAVVDSIDNFRSKRTGNRVKISFLLNEPAIVRYSLKGPSRRTVRRGRLEAGIHSFTLRRLRRGNYRGVLTVVDDFDKKVSPRNFFVVR
jgi:plastocyanin